MIASYLAALALLVQAGASDPPEVLQLPVPDGGVQPQVQVDDHGAVHLVFLTGDPSAADVKYARLDRGATEFTEPVRVNRHDGNAIAVGTIRGAKLALGTGRRMHVIWNGSNSARPLNQFGGSPLLYSRTDDAGRDFEPERNLMIHTSALDGGASIAADRHGTVHVLWHARADGDAPDESHRRLWIATSTNDGETFPLESPCGDTPTGACACCGTGALVDRTGSLQVLFRGAVLSRDRGVFLFREEPESHFRRATSLDHWPISACPMSSFALVDAPGGPLAAWDTDGTLRLHRLRPDTSMDTLASIPGGKHPAVAVSPDGWILLAWTEGTAWQKGGDLAWQLFRNDGRPAQPPTRVRSAVPVWGHPAAAALPDGRFLLLQ